MRSIESRSNTEIKLISSLADKKSRDENGLFFFEGAHLLEEYLSCGFTPEGVYVNKEGLAAYSSMLEKVADKAVLVSDSAFGKISTEKAPQGVITVTKKTNNVKYGRSEGNGSCVMLASVRDAGNLGTILRTAVAFGIRSVVCSADCADIFGFKTVRASMGAAFKANVTVTDDLVYEIESRRNNGLKVYASALDRNALRLHDGLLDEADSVVIGNEGRGIPQDIIAACGNSVFIPIESECESLNASVAASVLMWEMRRARHG